MKKEEFIRRVTASVRGEAAQRNIERELQAHIDELAAGFTEDGCSPEEAEEKAVARMGNEEKLSYQFARVYRDPVGTVILTVELLAYLFGIFVAFGIFVFFDSSFEIPFLWLELFFVGGSAAFLAYGVKNKNRTICLVAAVYSFLYSLIRALSGAPFLLILRYLLKGDLDTYASISQTLVFPAGMYRVVSIAFYVLFIALAFAAAGLLKVKGTGRFKKHLTVAFAGLAAVQLVLLLVSVIALRPYPSRIYDGFYLVGAEQITEMESLKDPEEVFLEIDYDWGTYHAFSRSDRLTNLAYSEEEVRLDDVILAQKKLSAEMRTEEPYVAIIPVLKESYIDPDTRDVRYRKVLDYQNARWFDVQEEKTLRVEAHLPTADWMICEITME